MVPPRFVFQEGGVREQRAAGANLKESQNGECTEINLGQVWPGGAIPGGKDGHLLTCYVVLVFERRERPPQCAVVRECSCREH